MAIATQLNALQLQALAALKSIDAQATVKQDVKNKADRIEFMSLANMRRFAGVVEEKLSALSTSELVRLLNQLAEEKQKVGSKVSPLITKMLNGDVVYPYVTYLAMARAFSGVLALPHSGQGGTTIKEFKITHPALLRFEPAISVSQYIGTQEEVMQAKVTEAFSKVALKYQSEGQWKSYNIGAILPEGTPGYVLREGNQMREGKKIGKKNFDFVVGGVPNLKHQDVTPMGDWKNCTMVKVAFNIEGFWVGTSTAEKFAGTLTKLCLDCVEESEDIQDTAFTGGVLAYEGPGRRDLQEYCEAIVAGEVENISMPQCWSGQETSKGAPTAESSAALTFALTGKRILKEQKKEDVLDQEGNVVDSFEYIWDTDEFVGIQNAISRSTIRTVVWGRWIDPVMAELLKDIHRDSEVYKFVDDGGDTYIFHKVDTRFEIFPGTMETATQKESLSNKPTGEMFTELTLVPAEMC